MIETKAVIYMVLVAIVYVYFKYKILIGRPTETESEIDSTTKILIDELHELKEQHTNIENFLFDYEQENQNKYTVTYTDGTGQKRTADIIKANEKNDYLKLSAIQQKQHIERKIKSIIEELAKIEKSKYKVTKTENEHEKRLPKGRTGGAVESTLKKSGDYIKSIIGDNKNENERELQEYEKL